MRKLLLISFTSFIFASLCILQGCLDDDTFVEEAEKAFIDYFTKTWNLEQITKCDSIDVLKFYTSFSLSVTAPTRDSLNNYLFDFVANNGTPAFPLKGKFIFPASTNFELDEIEFERSDSVKMRVINLFQNLLDTSQLDLSSFDNAECEEPGGRQNSRGNYILKLKR